ncbi:MAG TPA: hypothetical protein VGV59_21565 [Pyrinomonadaceae bacterium]|nr:hypothetical protein [Pyrinomonadaceae bacterium]
MSSEQEQARALAERIARRLSRAEGREGSDVEARAGSGDAVGADLSALRAGLSEIQRRLAHIESHIRHDETCDESQPARAQEEQPATRQSAASGVREDAPTGSHSTHARWLSGTYVPATEHPSAERFGIGEAVSEIVDYFEREKTCSMEPGDKPCDHCAMCSSRGF